MRSWTIAAACASLIAFAQVAACSGSDDGGGGSGGDGGGTSTTSTTSTTSAGGGGSGGECSMLPTYDECDDCECANHQAGCDAYFDLEDDHCACNAGAPCEAECAAYCAGGSFDAACEGCFDALADNDPCWDATDAACAADPACNEFVTASDASCSSLPD